MGRGEERGKRKAARGADFEMAEAEQKRQKQRQRQAEAGWGKRVEDPLNFEGAINALPAKKGKKRGREEGRGPRAERDWD